jgi:CubicO group peptidase (beta-lactamase class C family)
MQTSRVVPHARPFRRPVSIVTLVLCAAVTSGAGAQGGPPPGAIRREMGPSPVSPAELGQKVRTLAEALTRQNRFSGTILLAQEGKTLFEGAYGFADREAKRPMTVGSIMNVSSIGKLFTQIAINQLAAAGKLSLDSTIATYWPDYPDRKAARTVTIRQLLAHRSGIDGDIFANPLTKRSNRDNLADATRGPLAFEPGTRTQYSNAGYVVLGEIVERLSGEVYHEYIRRHVFAVAGMTASAFPAIDSLPPSAAVGYTWGLPPDAPPPSVLPPLTRSAPMQPRRGSAAGGAYSNVQDLLRFVTARRIGAFGIPARRSQEIAAGGSPGSNAMIAEGLPGGYDVIVLANFDPPTAGMIVDSVEHWITGGRGPGGPGGPGGGPAGGPRIIMRAPGQPSADDPPPLPQGPLQRTLPDTPQGRAAGAYLRAFSTGDAAAMRTFIDTQITKDGRSLDERVSRYQEIFADLGPLSLVGVRVAPDGGFALQVNSAKNGELTMLMSFEAVAPFRIAGVQFRMER